MLEIKPVERTFDEEAEEAIKYLKNKYLDTMTRFVKSEGQDKILGMILQWQ